MNGLGVLQARVLKKLVPSIFRIGSVGDYEVNRCRKFKSFGEKSLALIQRYVYEETGISVSIFDGSSISKNTVFGLLTRYLCHQGTEGVLLEIANFVMTSLLWRSIIVCILMECMPLLKGTQKILVYLKFLTRCSYTINNRFSLTRLFFFFSFSFC